jgi:hypothetical protein
VSFDTDIKPSFRERDRQSTLRHFDLWSYADVSEHAAAILARLREGSMPCDDTWPEDRVQAFQRWVDSGRPR